MHFVDIFDQYRISKQQNSSDWSKPVEWQTFSIRKQRQHLVDWAVENIHKLCFFVFSFFFCWMVWRVSESRHFQWNLCRNNSGVLVYCTKTINRHDMTTIQHYCWFVGDRKQHAIASSVDIVKKKKTLYAIRLLLNLPKKNWRLNTWIGRNRYLIYLPLNTILWNGTQQNMKIPIRFMFSIPFMSLATPQ